jgi:hypothetical protein
MRQSSLVSIILIVAIATFSPAGGRVLAAAPSSRPSIASSAALKPKPSQNPNVRVGEVVNVNQGSKLISIRTDSGDTVAVSLMPETVYKRVQPGVASLDKATPITLADIGVGDRVYMQGRPGGENQFAAHQVLVMSKSDLNKVREREKEQWRKGISGQISGLTSATGRISVKFVAPEGAKTITLIVTSTTVIRRYARDSVRFSDATPAKFEDLKVGDQIRARGEKSADGSLLTASEIVSGSFQTVGGIVTAVNPSANEVKITVLGSKKSATVIIKSDTIVRKLTPQLATLIAQRSRPPAAALPPGAAPAAAPPRAAAGAPSAAAAQPPGAGPPPANRSSAPPAGNPQPSSAPQSTAPASKAGQQPAVGGAPGAAAPKAGAQPGAAAPAPPPRPKLDERKDTQDLIEELPALPISEIKQGDVIVVSSTTGPDPTRLNAIMFVTGVDAVLNAYYRGQRPPDLNTGLPAGLLLGIGQP